MSAPRATLPRPGRAPGAHYTDTLMSAAEHRARIAVGMSEETLLATVRALAQTHGWMEYHTYRSTRSTAGFPDLVLASARRGRIIYAELKTSRGRITRAQDVWLRALESCGAEVHVWRPADLLGGTIAAALASPARRDAS